MEFYIFLPVIAQSEATLFGVLAENTISRQRIWNHFQCAANLDENRKENWRKLPHNCFEHNSHNLNAFLLRFGIVQTCQF